MIFVLFTGFSGAGKSTVAKVVGERWKLPVIEERQVVASLTNGTQYVRTRDWIKSEGIGVVRKKAAQKTIRLIQECVNRSGAIIDGCYDPQFPKELGEIFPGSKILVVCIEADRETRLARIAEREGITKEEALKEAVFIDGLKVSAGMQELIEGAHLRTENFESLEKTIKATMASLESQIMSASGVERRF